MGPSLAGRHRVLWLSTTGFTLMFAVWLMFGILGKPIQEELDLSEVQLSWLIAAAVLNGSLWRLPAGMITDRIGGRKVMTFLLAATAVPAYLVSRADSYGMPGVRIDGMDINVVHATVADAVARARAGEGPTFIEAMTYRYKGHSRADPGAYRPEGELEQWLERDPILLHERALVAQGVEQERLDAMRAEAEKTVADALERAMSWDDPAPESRLEDVYA